MVRDKISEELRRGSCQDILDQIYIHSSGGKSKINTPGFISSVSQKPNYNVSSVRRKIQKLEELGLISEETANKLILEKGAVNYVSKSIRRTLSK